MPWNNFEYIPLRLLRRYLFPERFLIKFGQFIPYYLVNLNQLDLKPIIAQYEKFLLAQGISLYRKNILEVGLKSFQDPATLLPELPQTSASIGRPVCRHDSLKN